MIRLGIMFVMAMFILGGCTAKEFSNGVGDGIDDVKRVVRGTNN
ncbi:MAG: hypothetical protein PHO27_03110 [Sulfuricurvum sp.]|nr:hypothetical protein [Sulfuricurvum sp.]